MKLSKYAALLGYLNLIVIGWALILGTIEPGGHTTAVILFCLLSAIILAVYGEGREVR